MEVRGTARVHGMAWHMQRRTISELLGAEREGMHKGDLLGDLGDLTGHVGHAGSRAGSTRVWQVVQLRGS